MSYKLKDKPIDATEAIVDRTNAIDDRIDTTNS